MIKQIEQGLLVLPEKPSYAIMSDVVTQFVGAAVQMDDEPLRLINEKLRLARAHINAELHRRIKDVDRS